jgi:type I restriction enzyme S subunit
MGEFEPTTLGRLLLFANGRSSPPRANDLPYRVYGSNGVIGFAGEANAAGETTIIGRVGSYCGSLYFSEGACWVTDNAIRATARDENCARFLFYLLGTLNLNNWRAGSGQPLLNQDILSHIPALAPKPREQRAIASILSALDDKIDLNRRMNETLEAMARAIFKDWFIDFGPTRAKMEGRASYLAPDLVQFPDRLDDEGKPEGWEFAKLGSLCERVAMGPFGSDITTDNFVDQGVPVVRGGNLKNGFIDDGFVYVTDAKADALRNANAFAQDIVITHRGTLGQVGIIPKKPAHARYVVSQSQMLLTAHSKKATPRFIFEFLRSEHGMQQLLAFTSQVGVPAIARPTTALKSLDVVVPSRPILLTFDNLLDPLVEREAANISEIRALVAIRDLLLPKLMSGQIRVKHIEKVMEAVL